MLYEILFFFSIFIVLDLCLRIEQKTKYFAIHIFANLLTMYVCFDEIIYGLANPLELYVKPTHFYGYYLMIALHLYHMIFHSLDRNDIFHHLLFVLFGCGWALYFQPYIVSSLPLLALHGFPGAMDYTSLILYKYGKIDKLQQKKFSANVNLWFRGPYALLISGMAFVSLFEQKRYECLPCVLLVIFNGLYYMNSTAMSYANAMHEANKN